MNEEKKFYGLCGCLIGATIISVFVEQKLQMSGLVYLLLICVSIGLCISAKLILNKEMTGISQLILNVLIVNGLIKLMVIGYCIFNKMKCVEAHKIYVDLMNHLLMVNMLQISSLCMVIWLLSGKAKYHRILWNAFNIFCIGLLLYITRCKVICSGFIYAMVKGTYAVGICVILGLVKWWGKRLPKEDVYFYKLFLVICIIREALANILIFKQVHFEMTVMLLLFLQWLLLFDYCYLKCAINPWKDKKRLLLEVGCDMAFQKEQSEHIVSLSHELKTPVNVIRSAIDLMLLDEKLENSTREELTTLKRLCYEIMNIIQNMIDTEKLEGNHMKCHLQVCNLVEVIENVLEAFSSTSEFEFQFNPLEEEFFQEVDIRLMQQGFMLLISLIINKEGEGPLYIEMGKEKSENEGITITIQHEAVGFLESISHTLHAMNEIHTDEMEHLTMQLIELIFSIQAIEMRYFLESNQKILQLKFPICDKQTEKWLDEENIELLKEQIKGRGLVRLL